jgi:hypothetical protein
MAPPGHLVHNVLGDEGVEKLAASVRHELGDLGHGELLTRFLAL